MQRWNYFKKVVAVPNTSATAGKFDFSGFSNGNLWLALIVSEMVMAAMMGGERGCWE